MNFMFLAVALITAFIYTETAPTGWEVFLDHIKEGSDFVGDYIVCEERDVPIGDLYYKKHDNETIEITAFQVDRDRRREGVGTALLKYLINTIARNGHFKKVKLDVSNAGKKEAAMGIYKSVGFKVVGGNLMELKL
ncbi:acetyltransferase (GNAT) family domain-containing protein [Ditylenchus destructor]|uniref:Acetyltransferase (GNAT) family domain-containing protein n=1 Tax=Ditylenchus destructor TaxID=166010 RepID=A0AAD4MHR5_9BILA|nr:acetyltransferase (GNAT) family domain-containing protein [Ditylenchus destructor]